MKLLKAGSLIALLLIMSGCGKRESDKIRIGCSAPLTGESANYGRSTKQGVDLAVSEINAAKYLDKPLEVIFEDDKMDPQAGVNAVRKLIDVDKVPVIIGPFGSSVVLATAPIANQSKTVIISASATADAIADAGDYVFRITPPNSKQGADIAEFCVSKLHASTAAVIFQNNDYGLTLRAAFEEKMARLGEKIVSSESAEGGATDFRLQLARIKQARPDVVFFPLHYRESATVLKQAKELGIKAKFISADGAMTEDLLKIAGDAAEGTYYSTLALAYGVSDSLIDDFTKRFKEANAGQDPDIYAAYYYEVTYIVAQALRYAGYSGTAIRDYLYRMSGPEAYNGITGTTSFDAKGEVNKSFYIYEVIAGKFVRTQS